MKTQDHNSAALSITEFLAQLECAPDEPESVTKKIEREHRNFLSIASEIAEREDVVTRTRLMKILCESLSQHLRAEQKLLYPTIKDYSNSCCEEAAEESYLLQSYIEDLLVTSVCSKSSSDAKIKVLNRLLTVHTELFEQKMLPILLQAKLNLDELGKAFHDHASNEP